VPGVDLAGLLARLGANPIVVNDIFEQLLAAARATR
jgi:hypothetical protein